MQAGSEIAKVVLQYSSENCYGVAFYEGTCTACMVRKLCFLRRLRDGVAESTSLLGARMFGTFGLGASEQESTWLVLECLELVEEWYGMSFTEELNLQQ